MCLQFARLRGVVVGALLALVCGGPAMADDTEIFRGTQSAVRPNILFIVDTSGSMALDDPPRIEVVQNVARDFINSTSDINLGLMRYDSGAEGGMVTVAIAPIEDARNDLIASIDGFEPDGNTPLSETLYEALQYYAGREVVFGNDSDPQPSVDESRSDDDPDIYRSPIELSCQKNYVVYLTDGLPTSDNSADDAITGLDIEGQTFDSLVAADCDPDVVPDAPSGRCLDDLAEFMFEADLRPDMEGDQNVITHTIGFGPAVRGSPYLQKVADRGGGEAFSADDAASLTEVLTTIANEIDSTGASFTAPSVAVNAFNRTETLDSVYFSVFEPTNRFHWPGNVKKYRVEGGQLVDANGDPAIDDATGMLSIGSQSFWSDAADVTVDDGSVVLGGAAGRLPDPAQRRLFTFLGSADLTAPTNAVDAANVLLTPELLGLGLPGLPTVDQLINWTRGFDVKDEDGDGMTLTESRLPKMGDPLHGQSALVVYGGSATAPLAVMFAPTNDGVLHALDAESGEELWAFIPPELLGRLVGLYEDNLTASKSYGLDGDIRAVRIDRNQNGIIEEGNDDRVLLFFGMRRGGNNYYALDVTDRENPSHLWTLGPTELPGVGQTWSTPAFTRIRVSGSPSLPNTDNPDGFALVFGGGYDETQDDDLYNTDAVGNRIFIVDALSGERLWFAGGTGIGTPNLALNGSGGSMNNSIPASVRVIDLDGDGFADRMYAADTGGRVWRFDIITDTDPGTAGQQIPDASRLVTGGVIASLGGAASPTAPTSARRFYETPDVALVQRRGAAPYFSISLGSGWRGHPLNTQIQDRFYSLRDYQPFLKFTQGDYNTRSVIADGDLADITTQVNPTVPVGSPGWRLELRLPGGFNGEKVLAESRTFNNIVFFPTYLPAGAVTSDPCAPTGNNRAYAVSVDDGRPVIDINRDQEITLEDRYARLAQGGIAPEITFLFPGQVGDGDEEEEEEDETQRRPVLCSSGGEFLPDLCVDAGAPVRTYWRQGRAQP